MNVSLIVYNPNLIDVSKIPRNPHFSFLTPDFFLGGCKRWNFGFWLFCESANKKLNKNKRTFQIFWRFSGLDCFSKTGHPKRKNAEPLFAANFYTDRSRN
jgi:hypothetical protein